MKITKEQLKEVQENQKELNETLNSIGYLESQKHALLHKIKTINENDAEIRGKLEKEYGQVNINIEDGTYTTIEEKIEENV